MTPWLAFFNSAQPKRLHKPCCVTTGFVAGLTPLRFRDSIELLQMQSQLPSCSCQRQKKGPEFFGAFSFS